jgi:hypothetical protein
MDATDAAEIAPHPAEQPTSQCHLLTVPPEIRDSILKYLLVSSHPLSCGSTDENLLGTHCFKLAPDIFHACGAGELYTNSPLTIAGACKQLSWEAVPIYYGKNLFVLADMRSRKKPSYYHLRGSRIKDQ